MADVIITGERPPLGAPDGRPYRPPTAPSPPPAATKPWWKYPWMFALAVLLGTFFVITLPRYVGLNRAKTPIALNPDVPLHYPFLIGHVLFGSIALITVFLQMWPWLRQNHRQIHRWVGRVYVFGGALPAGLFALLIMPYGHGQVGNAISALLWLTATIAGFRAGWEGRYAAHRRYMIYSFALSLQLLVGRAMYYGLTLTGHPLSDPTVLALFFETASWLGFVVNLLIAHWWLERTARRPLVLPA